MKTTIFAKNVTAIFHTRDGLTAYVESPEALDNPRYIMRPMYPATGEKFDCRQYELRTPGNNDRLAEYYEVKEEAK